MCIRESLNPTRTQKSQSRNDNEGQSDIWRDTQFWIDRAKNSRVDVGTTRYTEYFVQKIRIVKDSRFYCEYFNLNPNFEFSSCEINCQHKLTVQCAIYISNNNTNNIATQTANTTDNITTIADIRTRFQKRREAQRAHGENDTLHRLDNLKII
jgi:hypothetical protein